MMAGDLDFEAIGHRALQADDVFDEIPKIIADLRVENIARGGDDRTFGLLICLNSAQITLPVQKAESQ